MPLPIRDLFNAVAAGLASDPLADTMIDIAATRINPGVFGRQYPLAVAYLAAHMLALSRRDEASGGIGGVGPLTGERAGEVSRNYGQVNFGGKDVAYWGSTQYGLEFLNILRSRPGTKLFTTGFEPSDMYSQE